MQSSVSSSQDLFLSWAPTTKDQLDFGTPGNWTLFEGFENEQTCSQVSHPSSIPLRNGSLAATKRYLEFGTTSNLDFQEGSIGKKSQARLSHASRTPLSLAANKCFARMWNHLELGL